MALFDRFDALDLFTQLLTVLASNEYFSFDSLQIPVIHIIRPYMMKPLYDVSNGEIVQHSRFSSLKSWKRHSLKHTIQMYSPEKI